MRINLMDASLQMLGGHPHDIDLLITKAMMRMGHDIHVYCHRDASASVLRDYAQIAPITPLFTIDPYKSKKGFAVDLGSIIKNVDGSLVTASELTKTRPADVWLWPSFYAHQLLACAYTKSAALISGCIHHPPDYFSRVDPAWWQYAFIQAQSAQLNLKISMIEPETRYPFLPLTVNGELHIAPFPYDGCFVASPRKEVRCIGVFGVQRQEKGEGLLMPILKSLSAQGYKVLLHNSNNYEQQFCHIDGIDHLGYVSNLTEELSKCDLVLAPYRTEAYYKRGSGIVMNAIACGVPVVAPAGSAPGRFVEQTGAGVLFNQYSFDSITNAVKSAINNYAGLANAAYIASNNWKNFHGVEKFINAMI